MRLPIIRGVVALYESLKIGMKALGISANAQLDEPDEEISGKTWGFTIFLSLAFAIGLFFVLPVTIANFWKDELGSSVTFVVLEKLIRISIFLGYLWAISRIQDLRRVFEYHGAEHKVISCYEAGDPLEPEYAQQPLPLPHPLRHELPADRDDHRRLRVRPDRPSRAAVADPLAHRGHRSWSPASPTRSSAGPAATGASRWVRGLMWPGLQLQRLTTREPSLDQLAVSIAALEAVLAVEDPSKFTDEDRLGMEVVA